MPNPPRVSCCWPFMDVTWRQFTGALVVTCTITRLQGYLLDSAIIEGHLCVLRHDGGSCCLLLIMMATRKRTRGVDIKHCSRNEIHLETGCRGSSLPLLAATGSRRRTKDQSRWRAPVIMTLPESFSLLVSCVHIRGNTRSI